MRDTSDMMEDALSEDTMMDCGGDSGEDSGGLEDFVNLTTDIISDNSRTIRDAAERLLTLLGMEEDNEDLLSSSEDEGVEVDISDIEGDIEETDNTKLLHQLAASLAQELEYSQKQSTSRVAYQDQNVIHNVEMLQDTSYLDRGCLQNQADDHPKMSVRQSDFAHSDLDYFDDLNEQNANFTKFTNLGNLRRESHGRTFDSSNLDHRLWTSDPIATIQQAGKSFGSQQEQNLDSWTAGWDACATEALRYLVEDEGLPPHHPTVIAMKNYLDLQRERAFTQYTGYTDTKSQDMSLLLD